MKFKDILKKYWVVGVLVLALAVTLIIISTHSVDNIHENIQQDEKDHQQTDAVEAVTEAPTKVKQTSHMIPGVEDKVIVQDELKAGCETYACTMLFNILGFDIDEITFANQYLDCHYVFEDEDGNMTGPDMYSAFAGTAYAGWGVYAPSMAKSMNQYLKDEKSKLKAYNYEDIPLETLCEEYTDNDIPVMIWATTGMLEPYVFDTWTVNYVDENAKTEIGDTFEWLAHEHCLVLVGYDEDEYYFDDSAAGAVSHFDKDLVAERYQQLGSQCIVVK